MRGLRFAWRHLASEWRSGELRILALALVVSVAAVSAVGFFTDRVRLAMDRQAGELLAADRVVESGQAIRPGWVAEAEALGLRTARTQSFRTVILAGENLQLTEVKAVDTDYPLRGTLRTAPAAFAADERADRGPAPGQIWLSSRLAGLLGVEPEDAVGVGAAELTFSRVLTYEPDRGAQLFSIAPRLMMNLADVARTELLGTGSLVTHRLLLAGDEDTLRRYARWLEPQLGRGERLLGGREARPEIGTALERAERFLGLAALVSVLLAGVAAAVAAHRHAERHLDAVAVMRCLGAGQRFVTGVFAGQLLLLGVLASAVGVAIGFMAQGALGAILGGLLAQTLPAPSGWPALSGIAIGLVTLAGFALPPLLGLRRVPPMRVLRHELRPVAPSGVAIYGAALAALFALMVWQARDPALALYVFGGAAGTVLVLWLAAAGLVAALMPLRRRVGIGWRFGLANIPRRAAVARLQVVAFGLGLMVLLLLALVRGDLLAGWQDSLPVDAPNHFLINIQPRQVDAVKAFIADRSGRSPTFYPMIRGRLVAINDTPVEPGDYDEPRARRLVQREFNLSHAEELAPDNRIVSGSWWGETPARAGQWSVEQGLAETLGIALGDRLRFLVAGRAVEGEVTSLRAVDWDSFRVNFFVIAPPPQLAQEPASWITSFYLPPADKGLLTDLVRRFPNVTVIDVDALMARVRAIIERVSQAVEFVFVFTLAAGIVVLLAAVQATHDERLRESALLRTLGAGRRQVRTALAAEFLVLGALSGLLAAGTASAIGYVLAEYVFHFEYSPNPWLWVAGLFTGTLGVGSAGLWGTRRVVSQAPLPVLRRL